MEKWRELVIRRPWGEPRPGGNRYLLSGPIIFCAVASAWAISLLLTGGIDPWPASSHERWAMTCPDCGIVEAVAALREPNGPGRSWRLYIRMSSGSLHQVVQSSALDPGQRVVLQGDQVRAVGQPWHGE